MKDYCNEVPVPVNRPPKDTIPNSIGISVNRIYELQDCLYGCLSRIMDGLSGNPTPHAEGNKPCGLVEHAELLVEQAKANCDLANTIHDMLFGER